MDKCWLFTYTRACVYIMYVGRGHQVNIQSRDDLAKQLSIVSRGGSACLTFLR